MKRQFVKSLCAFCTGVMTLVAASSLVVSCYDDSALREDLEEMKGELSELDARLQAIEALKDQLTALTARVDALYTLQFQVSDNNELQYSFDGKDWKGTGIILAEECDAPCECVPVDPCSCPEVSLVDNGDSVTIKVGDAEFTIEKPQEIVFEIRAGKLYFESEGTQTVAVKTVGIEDLTVMAAPKGWWAEINSDGKIEITAPDYESTQGGIDYETWVEIPAENTASGYVKVHACGADGKCMVGKIAVEVINQPLVIKAYAGKAYFTLAGQGSYWNPTFFYGVSTKETLEADTKDLLARMNEGDYDIYEEYLNNYGELSVTVSIAELLGEEPKVGNEYIVWAVLENSNSMPYDAEDIVLSYYSPVNVTVVEDEAERTAFNVSVNIEVAGVDSYVALAFGGFRIDEYTSIEYYAELLATGFESNIGTRFNEDWKGSVLEIGINSYEKDSYIPDSDVYLMILPLDGRSSDEYTINDVQVFKFKTAPLQAGGSVNVTAEQVTEYMGEVWDNDTWSYVEALIKVDPYTELCVEVTPSSTSGWAAFYYQFLTEEQWADYGAYDEDLVDLLLEGWGMTPTDVEKWPQYLTEKVDPATTLHFVAFFVDKDGKYGELAKVKLTSEELKKAEISWVEPYTTNLVDGSLKNTQALEFTPVTEGEAASYKYVWLETTYGNYQYGGKDDAQMAEEIFFSSSAKTVTAADLVDGKIVVDGHDYGSKYYFAILPLDADGVPGNSAAILEYTCDFALDNVITEGAAFDASEPKIVINIPTELTDGFSDGIQYYYEYQDYYKKYRFYYEVTYSVDPVPGTTVCSVLVDTESYTLGSDSATRAAQVWQGSFGSYYTATTSEKFESSFRSFSNYEDEFAPEVYLCVSWTDAGGNYYYKEFPLQAELQKLADKLSETLGLEKPELPTPDGKQWSFEMAAFGGAMAVLDFGVSMEGQCVVAYDPAILGAPEGTPYQIFNMIGYEFEPVDATSGKLTLITVDMFGDELTQEYEYSDLTDYSCYFAFGDSFVGQDVDGLLTEVEIDMSGGIMQ